MKTAVVPFLQARVGQSSILKWLLLCFYALSSADDAFSSWLQSRLSEYRSNSRDDYEGLPPPGQIESMLELVSVAGQAVPDSPWTDSGLNSALVMLGARIFANESFMQSQDGSDEPTLAICWIRTA